MNENPVTTDELAEQLPEILDRVRDKHKRFIVMGDDVPIARIEPFSARIGVTSGEIIAKVGNLPRPADRFADDLEEIRASQQPLYPPPWPS